MCEIKIRNLYVCPICKKEYKRKGHYLNLHLKKCGAIAWIPKVRAEIVMRKMNEERLAQAIDMLIEGNFVSTSNPIERIKKERSKFVEAGAIEMQNCFKEFKENGVNLIPVALENLHHIYNIMVAE